MSNKLLKDDTGKRIASAIESLYTGGRAFPIWDAGKGEFDLTSIERWLESNADGKQYGVDFTLDGVQQGTKVLANEGIANPVPSTQAKPGSDPYWQVGPFRWEWVNGYVDDDGAPHITGMRSFGNFSLAKDVLHLSPVRYCSYGVVDGKYRIVNSDTPAPGLEPEQRSTMLSGVPLPFMLRAVFAASKDENGIPMSVPYAKLWTRTCSHNSMNDACHKKGKAYSGLTYADMDYLYDMFVLKYANKSSQTVFAGCTGHTEQTPVTVAATASATVTIAASVADKWPVGSAVMVGTSTTANVDRGSAAAYDLADHANIAAKAVDGDNVTLTLDCEPFDSAVGQMVSTSPWNPGACVGVRFDGSPTSCTSGREPFMLNGIECMLGTYEILGDSLVKYDGKQTKLYLCPDTSKTSTDVTADYFAAYSFPASAAEGWKYQPMVTKQGGCYAPTEYGGSSGTGVGDGIYVYEDAKKTTCEFRAFGDLWSGGIAGLRFGHLSSWPGWAWWSCASRVSLDGRNGVNPGEQPQAA